MTAPKMTREQCRHEPRCMLGVLHEGGCALWYANDEREWWAVADKDGRITKPREQSIDLDAGGIWDGIHPETAPHRVVRVTLSIAGAK